MARSHTQNKIQGYALALLMIGGINCSILCVDETGKSWSGDAWEAMKHPVVAGLILMTGKYVVDGVVYTGGELYATYWLTEEQQKERLEKLSEAEKERRVARQTKEVELAVLQHPDWVQLAIEHKRQQVAEIQYTLKANAEKEEQNKLALMEERIKIEKQEIEHLEALLAKASEDKRQDLQALKDARIQDFFNHRVR